MNGTVRIIGGVTLALGVTWATIAFGQSTVMTDDADAPATWADFSPGSVRVLRDNVSNVMCFDSLDAAEKALSAAMDKDDGRFNALVATNGLEIQPGTWLRSIETSSAGLIKIRFLTGLNYDLSCWAPRIMEKELEGVH